MKKKTSTIALGLALIGFATIVAAWWMSRSDGGIPEWTPVNSQLKATMASLHAEEKEPAKANPAPSADAPITSIPSSATSSAEIPTSSGQSSTTPSAEPPITSDLSPSAPSGDMPLTSTQSHSEPNTEPSANEKRLDLNAATQSQLEDLPGIGPSKAKAILAYRDQHGSFRSVDELLNVKGIGPKVYAKLQPEVYVR